MLISFAQSIWLAWFSILLLCCAVTQAAPAYVQVRGTAWKALAAVVEVYPGLLSKPQGQVALQSAFSAQEKAVTVCLLRLAARVLLHQWGADTFVKRDTTATHTGYIAINYDFGDLCTAQLACPGLRSDDMQAAHWLQVQDVALHVLSNFLSDDVAALRANQRLIIHASSQNSATVRKRAIDVLWGSYIKNEKFVQSEGGLQNVARLLSHSLRQFVGVAARTLHGTMHCLLSMTLLTADRLHLLQHNLFRAESLLD